MPWPLIEQPAYSGPLDLLLYLIEQEEIDPVAIKLNLVIEPYLAAVRALREIDLDETGEFLIIASSLLEIKSSRLLPQKLQSTNSPITSQPDELVVVDSKEELIRQLAEYRRYRSAAMALHGMATEQSKRLSRRNAVRGTLPANFQPVELWDLVSSYARLVRETRPASVERLVVDFVPLPVIIDEILKLVNLEGKITLKRLVQTHPSRPRLIGLFLAILDLLKNGEILAGQEFLYGDIWIISGSGSQPSKPIIFDASSS